MPDPGAGDRSARIPNTTYCMRQEDYLKGLIDNLAARVSAAGW